MTGLSAAEYERARTWLLDIAETVLADTHYRDEGAERRFTARGGLVINKRSGAWCSHSAQRGGYSPITFIVFLKQCSADEAGVWLKAFLSPILALALATASLKMMTTPRQAPHKPKNIRTI
jgi:hypothetical protein